MPPILGSLSPAAIRLRHLLARSSSPAPAPSSSIVPNAATLATGTTPSRRSLCNYTKCEEHYHWLTWRVLPVVGLVFWYSQEKQNTRIKKLKESVAKLNKEKEKKKMGCSCSAPPPRGATMASTTTVAAAPTSSTTDAAAPVPTSHP